MLLLNIFFSFVLPLIFIFIFGAWTIVPEGKNEKFSSAQKSFSAILWFLVASLIGLFVSFSLTEVITNYEHCNELSSQCLFSKPEKLEVNWFYLLIPLIIYALGCRFGVFADKYFKENGR